MGILFRSYQINLRKNLKMSISNIKKKVQMAILPYSEIKENNEIYIINGNWSAYVIRDFITKSLFLYIPLPHERYRIQKIEKEITYDDLFPSEKYEIKIKKTNSSEYRCSVKIPFNLTAYATDENNIYEIINDCEGYSLITMHDNPNDLNEIKIELKNLVTDEIVTKHIKDVHIEEKDDEFNQDLVYLMNSEDLAVKAYLKAAYLYSKDFKQKIDKSQELIKS